MKVFSLLYRRNFLLCVSVEVVDLTFEEFPTYKQINERLRIRRVGLRT